MRLHPWVRNSATRYWEAKLTWVEKGSIYSAYVQATDLEIAKWDESILKLRRRKLIEHVLSLFEIKSMLVRRGH